MKEFVQGEGAVGNSYQGCVTPKTRPLTPLLSPPCRKFPGNSRPDAWSLPGQTGAPGHLASVVPLISSKKCRQLLILEGTPHTSLEISPHLLLVSGSSLHLTDEELRPAGKWDDFPRLTEKEIREAGTLAHEHRDLGLFCSLLYL